MPNLIDRDEAIKAVHKVIYDYFDVVEDDDESPITYKDKQLLEINKKITQRIKALPTADVPETNVGDMISRQAAIKLAIDLDYESRGVLKESKCREIENRFNMIPSAHPELNEWCTDCKEYDQERHCCPRWNQVIRITLEELKARNKDD